MQQNFTLRRGQVLKCLSGSSGLAVMPEYGLLDGTASAIMQEGWIMLALDSIAQTPQRGGTPQARNLAAGDIGIRQPGTQIM